MKASKGKEKIKCKLQILWAFFCFCCLFIEAAEAALKSSLGVSAVYKTAQHVSEIVFL
jgi:hypothetical protein